MVTEIWAANQRKNDNDKRRKKNIKYVSINARIARCVLKAVWLFFSFASYVGKYYWTELSVGSHN